MARHNPLPPAKRKKLYLAAAKAFAKYKNSSTSYVNGTRNEELGIDAGLCSYFIDMHHITVYGESFRQLPELRMLLYNKREIDTKYFHPNVLSSFGHSTTYVDNLDTEGAKFRVTLCLLAIELLKTKAK